MNKYDFIKHKKEKSNFKANIDNNRYSKINIMSKESKNNEGPTFILSRNKTNKNINKIKLKYGLFGNSSNPQIIYNKIQVLKNKYLTNNKINNLKLHQNKADYYNKILSNKKSLINSKSTFYNDINNKYNLSNQNIKKRNLFRNSSLHFSKENNIMLNNFTFTNKIQKNIDYNKITNNENKQKLGKNFKYLKNTRDDYLVLDKKLNEILKNEIFKKNIDKKINLNAIYPISKKINMLSEIKKDIKNLEEKSFNDKLLTPKKENLSFSNKYSDIYQNNSEKKIHLFDELFSDDINLTSNRDKENEIIKPILIKSISKPKFNFIKYTNFFK